MLYVKHLYISLFIKYKENGSIKHKTESVVKFGTIFLLYDSNILFFILLLFLGTFSSLRSQVRTISQSNTKLFCMCSSVTDAHYHRFKKTVSCQWVTHTIWQTFLRKQSLKTLQPLTLDSYTDNYQQPCFS